MRLLNTKSFEFQEFFDADIPEYAILSHRWTKEELSHHDFVQRRNPHYAGYAKIKAFCKKVSAYGIGWGWVDTCCIDKSSSAELSEAMNSMFRWYKEAKICLVYLSDVHLSPSNGQSFQQSFVTSQWFMRGWTLQELIAPRHVNFFDSGWHKVGSKRNLGEVTSERTGVKLQYLLHRIPIHYAYIAERMSWAAHRKTSRNEDIAYCLLGMFDIQMPLLYGEGNKAFARLQEEIIRKSDDESIFAYSTTLFREPSWELFSLFQSRDRSSRWMVDPLPATPDMYSPNSVDDWTVVQQAHRKAYAVTNKGIHMDIDYHELYNGIWLVPLLFDAKETREPYYMLLKIEGGIDIPINAFRIQAPQPWIRSQLLEMGFRKNSDLTFKKATIYLTKPRNW